MAIALASTLYLAGSAELESWALGRGSLAQFHDSEVEVTMTSDVPRSELEISEPGKTYLYFPGDGP